MDRDTLPRRSLARTASLAAPIVRLALALFWSMALLINRDFETDFDLNRPRLFWGLLGGLFLRLFWELDLAAGVLVFRRRRVVDGSSSMNAAHMIPHPRKVYVCSKASWFLVTVFGYTSCTPTVATH